MSENSLENNTKKKLELEAIDALNKSNYSLAEDIYLKLIDLERNSKEYNNNLANIYLISKKIPQAIKHYEIAINNNGKTNAIENQSIAYNLSCAYQINNDLENTIKYLVLTVEINPNHKSAINKIENLKNILLEESNSQKNYYNLANFLHRLKNYKQAEKYYLLDINYNNSYESNYNLASIYQKLKDYEKALKYYKNANNIKPNDNVGYLINSIEENDIVARPPKKYISNLFDYYSENYEQDLIKNLSYKVPEYFFEIFKKEVINKDNTFNVLDLGCGTGLVGQKLKISTHKVSSILGVDLSKKMLEIARSKNIYNKLYHEDIIKSLNNLEIINSNINMITAADVLVYIGQLDEIFYSIGKNFKSSYFLFSCESNDLINNFKLTKSGRYQHSDKYILELFNKNNFSLLFSGEFQLRKNLDETVKGNIYLAIVN